MIDPKTYKVIKDIKVSRRPRDMHFSVDRSKLYVACGDDDVIDILDVAKLEVIGRIPTGPSPETFAIDEAKRRIYVANEEGSSLSIIDMDQAITVHEVPTGAEPEGVYVAEDGKTLEREYYNLFLLTFDDEGRCSEFREWYTKPQGQQN